MGTHQHPQIRQYRRAAHTRLHALPVQELKPGETFSFARQTIDGVDIDLDVELDQSAPQSGIVVFR